MNHTPTFDALSLSNLQNVSGGFSYAIYTGPGCILWVPGYPKENPVVPGPGAAMTE